MNRILALAPMLLFTACTGNGINITQIPSQILVTPAIVDLDEVAVGDVVEFTIQIDHIAGQAVQVRAVDVFNIEGDAFSFVGETPVVEVGGTVFGTLEYAPTEGNYDRAVVTVISDAAQNPEVEVDVRGRGVEATVDRWPAVLDYGPVTSGTTRVKDVSVFNDSAANLTILGADLVGDGFTMDESFPMALPANQVVDVRVRYTATDDLSSEGDLTLDFGAAAEVRPIVVRANACIGGSAALYDVDEDGWTVCAGDCDDNDGDVHPGAAETVDNVDEDCDDLIDQGTIAYDDDGDGNAERDGDCNDDDPNIGPHRPEIDNDGLDNDCDGVADTGSDDIDQDGVSPTGGDCNDLNSSVHPGAAEIPDGVDNDCDFVVDEGTFLFDDDGDGYCESTITTCSDGSSNGDCDDTAEDHDGNGSADGVVNNPQAPEAPDGIDNNCNGEVDEGTIAADDDGDGFTEEAGDCNDDDAGINPGQVELVGNGEDDDCDASTAD